MIVKVRESSMVYPAQETEGGSIWSSNLDLLAPNVHSNLIFFFSPNASPEFFDCRLLKEALSRVLVPFYPLAGRLRTAVNGRVEVDCNAAGVLFVQAESDSALNDLADFAPGPNLQQLAPAVDCSPRISSCPILLLQVTYFKCGGASIGASLHHLVADGQSSFHFINSWAEMARSLSTPSIPPIFYHTLLRARNPPTPTFNHTEFHPPPSMTTPRQTPKSQPSSPTSASIFKLTLSQLNMLKIKSIEHGSLAKCTTFEALAAHTWRCACKARLLRDDQVTTMYIPVDGRCRLRPPIPGGYIGNVIFKASCTAVVGDLLSRPPWYAASRIHDATKGMDNAYLKSAIDYVELNPQCVGGIGGPESFRCPNLRVNSWAKMPIYDADFGWGRPAFMGPAESNCDGLVYIQPSPSSDGSLYVAIILESTHMEAFKNVFYDIETSKPSHILSSL